MTARRSGGSLRTFAVASVLLGVLVVGALVLGWTLINNPFSRETVDRSPAPVLQSLQSIAEFHAARGNFEVIVDLESDVQYLPSALAGTRVLFVGVGSVDSYVDFSGLGDQQIQVSEDGLSVTVTVPRPELSAPTIDPAQSHVIDKDKGLLDRLGDLLDASGGGTEQDLYVAAAAKMSDAAASAGLQQQAEEATTEMLTGLLTGLGYEHITVNFEGVAPAE
jgi:hypothetical protein